MISERIKYLRVKNKLTQKKTAEIAGVQEVSFQRFEYGTLRPSLDTLIILADYFGVSLDYLVGRTDKPEINK
ncbi:MAG: helix-turn-helix domain-containing protein [Oscillospiraceae bacterium]|nr:helix-turn-helix domain-containing protein [Oscillospiraceae bacterium]